MKKAELINKKFGRWTVLSLSNNVNNIYKKGTKCSCVCECGTKRDVLIHSLVYNQSLSCGCYGKEIAKNLPQCQPKYIKEDKKASILYCFYKSGALTKRHMEFSLTPEEFYSIVTQPCYYCNRTESTAKSGMGIDRILNDVGYTISNSRPSCLDCNKAKSNLTCQEFYDHITKIYEFQKAKGNL
jgi:hypothetical protein